jgi:peptidoglycan hydrolase-like protein with peptidoglycan-binding domain
MNSSPTLGIGATGHDVRKLQRIFVMMKAIAPGVITGNFDVTTEHAIKDFQQGAGLRRTALSARKHGRRSQLIQIRRHYREARQGSAVTALQKPQEIFNLCD